MFLILMVMGLVGLLVMAIPAFGGHGHAPPTHGLGDGGGHLLGHAHGAGHGHGAGHVAGGHGHAASPGPSSGLAPAPGKALSADGAGAGVTRFIPSPRAVFSVLALYGAFGNALVHAGHLGALLAAALAGIPALAVERFAVTPLWNLLFRFQGKPSSPLEALILAEGTAVTPFRNGRGLVSVVRDGRLVQFSARLRDDQAASTVRVGQRLQIEDVDSTNERVTVSLIRD